MAMNLKYLLILSIFLFLIWFKTLPSDSIAVEKVEEVDIVDNDNDAFPSYNHESWDDGPVEVVDEKDVVVLKESNFSEFIGNNKYVMVDFYAPWCIYSKALKPVYAATATELKGGEVAVVLAKVDASEEYELSRKYHIQGFPTVYLFIDGIHKTYYGERSKEAIIAWLKKKTGPSLYNLTTTEEAEKILATGKPVALGYLNALVGSESNELAVASILEDDVDFYQTTSSDVAKLFQIDPEVKRPTVVVIMRKAEKINPFDGEYIKLAIADYVSAYKLPLVINLTRESAHIVYDHPIKKQLILFATSKDSEKFLLAFKEAVQVFKGKVISFFVELDNEEAGQLSKDFGVSENAPSVLALSRNKVAGKFLLYGEISVDNIKSFGEKFLQDKLRPFYKSDPIPEKNDGNVKIVVGNKFGKIVLDESKDVLLEIYAPWCEHCQLLEPIYNKLGKDFRSIGSLVIAKMDGTTNKHPRAKVHGFPTILFFPAGNKSFDPITIDRNMLQFPSRLRSQLQPIKLRNLMPSTAMRVPIVY